MTLPIPEGSGREPAVPTAVRHRLGRRGFIASVLAGSAAGAVAAVPVAQWRDDDPAPTQPPPGATVLVGRGIDPTGETDSTDGLQRVIDLAGHGARLWLPEGLYLVDGIVLRPGQSLSGAPARAYTGRPDHGARLRARLASQTDPVLTVGEFGHLSDIAVEGNGRAQPAVRPGGLGVVVERVTMVDSSIGFDAGYVSGNVIASCQIHENEVGIANLVDSIVQACAINANGGDGIALGRGANDNVFQGNKIEWNDGCGLQAYQAEHNLVVGGIVDRNGRAGVRLVECGHSAVVGSVLRRNGRLARAVPDDDCHVYQQRCSGVVITGIVTNSGGDDDRGGYVSPAVAVRQDGGEDICLTGNDLTGATASAVENVSGATSSSMLLNVGVDGVQTASGARVQVGSADVTVPPGGSASVSFRLGPSSGEHADTNYRLVLVARDQATGARTAAEALLVVFRDDGDPDVAVGELVDRIGNEVAGRFRLRAVLSADGATLTVTSANAGTAPARLHLELV
jgi:hypothetical protein